MKHSKKRILTLIMWINMIFKITFRWSWVPLAWSRKNFDSSFPASHDFLSPLKIPKYLSHSPRVVKTLWRTSMCLRYSKENYLGHSYLKLFIPKWIMIWDSYKRPIVLPLKSWRWLSTACCDNRVFGYLQFLVVWFIQLSLSVFVTAAVARDATSPLNILFCFLEHGR